VRRGVCIVVTACVVAALMITGCSSKKGTSAEWSTESPSFGAEVFLGREFSIDIPLGWETHVDDSGGLWELTAFQVGAEENFPGVSVEVGELDERVTPESYVEAFRSRLNEQLSRLQAEVIHDFRITEVGGVPALYASYIRSVQEEDLVVEWYSLGRGRSSYSLYIAAPRDVWAEWAPTLRRTVDTFQPLPAGG